MLMDEAQFRGEVPGRISDDAEVDARILVAGEFGLPVEDFFGEINGFLVFVERSTSLLISFSFWCRGLDQSTTRRGIAPRLHSKVSSIIDSPL